MRKEIEAWLKEQSEAVQKLALEFPLGTEIQAPDGLFWVVGYSDQDQLVVTHIAPYGDAYPEALAVAAAIPAGYMRGMKRFQPEINLKVKDERSLAHKVRKGHTNEKRNSGVAKNQT